MNRQGFGADSTNISMGIPRNGGLPSGLTEEEMDDLQGELTKVEDEIQTLRQVLFAKEKYAMDIRGQLGMGPFSDLKQNLAKGWQDVQTSSPYLTASATLKDISRSNAYKRTQETLSQAGQVTTATLSSVGVAITRRLGEMRALPLPSPPRPSLSHSISVPGMRPSNTFKSFEDMVGSMKDKMAGSRVNGFDRSPSQDGPF